MRIDAACSELQHKAGTQFDPAVVRTAVPVLRNLGLVVAETQRDQLAGPTALNARFPPSV